MITQEPRSEALGDRLLQDRRRPAIEVHPGLPTSRPIEIPGEIGPVGVELLGKGDVGRRVMLGRVVVNFPATIFFVADLPVLDIERGRVVEPEKVEAVVNRQRAATRRLAQYPAVCQLTV